MEDRLLLLIHRVVRVVSSLAEGVIARALREVPSGHKYDRVLTAKMTAVCVLVACQYSIRFPCFSVMTETPRVSGRSKRDTTQLLFVIS